MYDRSLYRGRKHFCRYCLHAFITEEILKCHIKDCFKINGKQTIKMPKKGEYVKFKKCERKIKSPFMISADFESIRKLSKHRKLIACSYGYKLVCVDDKCSKPFKSYLGEDAVYNFIGCMIEESKYCSDVVQKHLNKELVMTKKDNEDFENSTKCWICDSDYIDNDVKVRDHCHITGKNRVSAHRDRNINIKLNQKIPVVFHKELVMTKKDNEDFENSTKCWICDSDYIDNDVKVRDHCHITGKNRVSAHRDRNINIKLNQKIPVVFHNLKNHNSHLIVQETGKLNLKINIIPNRLEKYMSFSINNKLRFIDSFRYLSSSLDSLVKNLNKDVFKYLSQEFDNNVLNLVKQNEFYPYKCMGDFK